MGESCHAAAALPRALERRGRRGKAKGGREGREGEAEAQRAQGVRMEGRESAIQ